MSLTLTHAMVLAAGLGTRMRPLTNNMPKPLIPVAGKPLIDYCLDWLLEGGITQAVINSSYLAEQLEAHVATRQQPAVRISREGAPPLETGGGVLKALPLLGEGPFLTMNSDAILPPTPRHPIAALCDAWRDEDFLLLLVPRAQVVGWSGNGDFIVDADGRVRRPNTGEDAPFVFTGIEIIHPRVFVDCPEGAFSLNRLWPRGMQADGWFARLRAVIHDGPLLNVGDLEGLAQAERYCAASLGKRT